MAEAVNVLQEQYIENCNAKARYFAVISNFSSHSEGIIIDKFNNVFLKTWFASSYAW